MSSRMVLNALGFTPADSSTFGTPVQNLTELSAVANNLLVDKQMRLVEDENAIFHFDAQSLAVTNGTSVIRPTAITEQTSGRWLLMNRSGGENESPPVNLEDYVAKTLIGQTGGVQPFSRRLKALATATIFTESAVLTNETIGVVGLECLNDTQIDITLPPVLENIGVMVHIARGGPGKGVVRILPNPNGADTIYYKPSYLDLKRDGDFVVLFGTSRGTWGVFSRSDSPLQDQVGHITTPPAAAWTPQGYQLTLADAGFVRCNASTGPMKLILPPEAISAGYKFFFKKTDLTTNKVTLATVTGDSIEGWNEYDLTVPREYVVLESCGLTNIWRIFASTPPTDKFYSWATKTAADPDIPLTHSMTGSHYVDASKGRAHLHLPPAAEVPAQSYFIKKTDASLNPVEVETDHTTTDVFDIGGNSSFELNTKGDYVRVASDGVTWRVTQQELHLNYGPPAYIDTQGTLVSTARFHLPFFNSGNNLSSSLLLAYGANSQPQYMSRNYKIKSIRVSVGTTSNVPTQFHIRLNGTTVNRHTVTLPAGQLGFTESALDILMNGTDTIQVFASNSNRMNNPTCIIEYCWRN